MWFGVLGPVRVRVDGVEAPGGSRRERLVLAVLLLDAGRVVAVRRLIDVLWPDGAPPTAKAQVHNAVSALRCRLGGDVIRTRAAGYEVRLDGVGFDLVEFRGLVRQALGAAADGEHQRVVDLVERALGLWRGRALADAPGDWAESTRRRLDDERLDAVELRLRGLSALGREDEALTELPVLVAEHPYRESLHEIRMAALAARGRQAEALAVYQEVHQRFREDLGVGPGDALVALQRRVLAGDLPARVVVNRMTPRQLPALTWRPVGRERLLAEVTTAVGGGGVAVLSGPGGIGKTTLALAIAHDLADRFPDGQLHVDLRGTRAPVEPIAVVARWLRAFGADRLPDDGDRLVALFRERLAGRRVLLVLDDAASAEQVRPLLPGGGRCGVLLTSRRRLADVPGSARWTVPELSDAAAIALIREVVGAERVDGEPDAAAQIVAACGNLPLAVAIGAARLSTRSRWTLAGFAARLRAERGRLDELAIEDMGVRAAIELSYRSLDPLARRVLRLLGLVPVDVPEWVLRRLGGTPELVDELVDVHLLEPLGADAVGQRRFRTHDLVADFARERAEAEDEAADLLHVRTGLLDAWLGLLGAADDLVDHGMISGEGVPVPDGPPDVLDVVRDAPRAWLDVERRTLVAAVTEAADLGLADRAARFALRLVGYLGLQGNLERAHVLRVAGAAVRAHGADPEVHGRLLTALIASLAERDDAQGLGDLLAEQRALAARTGDRVLEVRSLGQSALVARRAGRLTDALRAAHAALDVPTDDLPTQVRSSVLAGLAVIHLELGRPEEGLGHAREAVELEREHGNARIAALHALTYGAVLLASGHPDEAAEQYRAALATATAQNDALVSAYTEYRLGEVELGRDRFAEAEQHLRHALGVFDAAGDRVTAAEIHRAFADLAVRRDDPDTARTHLETALALWQGTNAVLETARVHARLDPLLTGRDDRAARRHRECWRAALRDLDLPRSALRLPVDARTAD